MPMKHLSSSLQKTISRNGPQQFSFAFHLIERISYKFLLVHFRIVAKFTRDRKARAPQMLEIPMTSRARTMPNAVPLQLGNQFPHLWRQDANGSYSAVSPAAPIHQAFPEKPPDHPTATRRQNAADANRFCASRK